MKIAINGFGRIGRCALKSAIKNNLDVEFVAINDLTDTKTLAHLFKYDSAYGVFNGTVEAKEDSIVINGKEIKVFAKKDPEELPWGQLGVDVVLECTGIFRDEVGAGKHIKAGAKKVIISAPAKEDTIPSYIMGINEKEYKGESIIDMGSCTTNCLAPVVKILEDDFGIEKGFMTTIHSYTNDQNILDLPHKDLRRARSAAENIIPTTTGAAKAIGKVIPSVKGKMDGIAVRVPTPVVSLVDLICELRKEVTAEEVNDIMLKYSDKGEMKGIFYVEKDPLVSSDFIGNPFSSIFDMEYTKADGKMVKILAWYDNEWAYALRMVELAKIIT
ncbi:MAG: type I glyceraldehyde-3-phosphate dehydrogenase [Candidatus Pacebacteria bacterium]|nr:type I glyceraldehyde-3-phosphate dehydrogenase [Candidatus Paceibacterota bacterium]MDD2757201.1 type I glyceraldehyde-3-phosphate dehydrogenase [Candidatus Paceibacterota bacterium]MDD3283758.1 type I glyceraldehyde-3-phosphate dehydrogenase [Candidatus Paceibacterota bacterium]MDD3969933.1 type I glyceraldehyde-3-phosphate dehydrogenase [Candidatus Paceibacterota bacterium]MDD4737810.1 type I glyceraldehyde-3-phosphate dehydrogenase [Candidatus Paceibacterota bacterium]